MVSNGLEIGKRALLAHKYALDVIGHNVANVNTEGYSRQRINLATAQPTQVPVMNKERPFAALGSGVIVSGIDRFRNEFFDEQYRDVQENYGEWNQKVATYDMIEGIFNEPSDTGIAANLDRFWNAWQTLSTPDPSSAGARSNLVSQASILANSLKQTKVQLLDLQENNDRDIELKVQEINQIADQIASLNGQIVETEASANANDLRDRRNVLVSKMAKYVNVEYYEDSYGSSTVAIGGVFIVADRNVNHLNVSRNDTNRGYFDIRWTGSNYEANITRGELYGLLESRDTITATFIDHLDTIAGALIDNVNTQHKKGFDLHGNAGASFFNGDTASDIEVNYELKFDISKVAAASRSDNPEGDGDNSKEIARIRNSLLLNSDTTTVDEYYQNLISDVGVQTAESYTFLETNEGLIRQISAQIESVSGVSIDEEMTELIKSEHAYGAAAKYLTVVNQTLDILMSMV